MDIKEYLKEAEIKRRKHCSFHVDLVDGGFADVHFPVFDEEDAQYKLDMFVRYYENAGRPVKNSKFTIRDI